jgi:hypothetical protein
MDRELVVIVSATDVQGSETHHHLGSEGVALRLEGVAPGARPHAGVGAHDRQLPDRDAIIQLSHPGWIAQRSRAVIVELEGVGIVDDNEGEDQQLH